MIGLEGDSEEAQQRTLPRLFLACAARLLAFFTNKVPTESRNRRNLSLLRGTISSAKDLSSFQVSHLPSFTFECRTVVMVTIGQSGPGHNRVKRFIRERLLSNRRQQLQLENRQAGSAESAHLVDPSRTPDHTREQHVRPESGSSRARRNTLAQKWTHLTTVHKT